MLTSTGNFPIGLRRGWSEWQKDLAAVIAWCRANDLSVLDVGADIEACRTVAAAGLHVGSADLPAWKELISPDRSARAAAVQTAAAFVAQAASAGAHNFFCVMLPQNPALPRAENFNYMVDSFAALAPHLEKHEACVVIEGWPGPGALCCTPEGYRALFNQVPSPSMAVNFDPSHLLRMGIDPVLFLAEFASRVKHVHGKDTEILSQNLYNFGTELPPIFSEHPPFGGNAWRYTIPGQGAAPWQRILQILRDGNYRGGVSIELEDATFNGTEQGEKNGILAAAKFLETC